DQLFSPVLEPRYLPLFNRYVLRMQAVYSTLDWLAQRLAGVGRDQSAWADLAGPAEVVERRSESVRERADRQTRAADVIQEVLDGGPAREDLRQHLRRSLGFSTTDHHWNEIDALLWSPPRSI